MYGIKSSTLKKDDEMLPNASTEFFCFCSFGYEQYEENGSSSIHVIPYGTTLDPIIIIAHSTEHGVQEYHQYDTKSLLPGLWPRPWPIATAQAWLGYRGI